MSVAADSARAARYLSEPLIINGEELCGVNYFTPKAGDESADLVIIATKWSGLRDALELIEPIVGHNTVVLPLLNGLLPYEITAKKFPMSTVLRGYYIGTTASRDGAKVWQSGTHTTVMEENRLVEDIFERAEIIHIAEHDMEAKQWQKLIINVGLNQCSALDGGLNFGQISASSEYRGIVEELMVEAESVAVAYGIEGAEGMAQVGVNFLDHLVKDDYSSMAQDVRSGRGSEIEIFGLDLIARAQKKGMTLKMNELITEKIKKNESSSRNFGGSR